ncbi:MAG TPA: FkbM family methyltransferase [Solirubrobacteraceae bacterium]|nr:FkbM family methyltransferase [Solirubrobacteraceae bacterium]
MIARGRARRAERRLKLAGPALLRAFADSFPEAIFVEIGANDGEQHDHLGPLIRAHRWRGVMVEPVPYVYARLERNYAGVDRVALENVAIADGDGTKPFFHLAAVEDHEREGLPRWYDGIGSFSRAAVVDHARLIPDIEQRLVTTEVPCLTFASLCERHGFGDIDLLVIDTEGYDHEILRHIDFTRYRPALVVYEHYHLEPDDLAGTRRRMDAAGYRTMAEGFDTWCLDPDADRALTEVWESLRPGLGELTVDSESR